MKQDFQFNMSRVRVNVYQMKMYAIETKNGIVINGGGSVKNQMIEFFVKKSTRGILVNVIAFVMKHVELVNIQILKNC